jgi:hypothetical protein
MDWSSLPYAEILSGVAAAGSWLAWKETRGERFSDARLAVASKAEALVSRVRQIQPTEDHYQGLSQADGVNGFDAAPTLKMYDRIVGIQPQAEGLRDGALRAKSRKDLAKIRTQLAELTFEVNEISR